MSGYQRINFKDQNVERPKTYDVTNNPDGSITLIESFGNVEELGTPINQENMNHIEDGIDAVSFSKFSLDLTYKKDDLVTDIQDDELKIFKSLKDNNFGHLPSEEDYWEEVEIASGKGSGFSLFDTKISDHILTGSEAKGWALQGTYVDKETYPDFYNRCLEQKNAGIESQVTLGELTLTMFVNENGHQFYNIADKPSIDAFYDTYGIADFYGIDEENERVFLPRNKYFQQLTDDISKVNEMVEAGLPNITAYSPQVMYDKTIDGAFFQGEAKDTSTLTSGAGDSSKGGTLQFDASLSNSIYGNSDTVQPPSSLKLLYYCVGNTEVTQAITNVVEVTTSENDTIPLFTGMYFDFKPNNVSWLKAGEQQNNAGIYKTCYDTLVNIVNGVNNYDLKVVNESDMVSGVVYDEYWILDQDNMTFRTPLTIATKSLSGAVVGNGMTLGLTDGTTNYGLSYGNNYGAVIYTGTYGDELGIETDGGTTPTHSSRMGITSDPTKSGIIAKQSTAQLYFKVANAVQNLELLNAGEVLESLSDKISRQDCLAYIVETYQNGGSWYRIYSDGWCEQGGNIISTSNSITVTLLKSYSDTQYSIILTPFISKTHTGGSNQAEMYHTKTNNSFMVSHYTNTTGFDWQACGYMA